MMPILVSAEYGDEIPFELLPQGSRTNSSPEHTRVSDATRLWKESK